MIIFSEIFSSISLPSLVVMSSMLFRRFLLRFGLSGQLRERTCRLGIKKDVTDLQNSALIISDRNVFLANTLASSN